jgi:hypothetical protein
MPTPGKELLSAVPPDRRQEKGTKSLMGQTDQCSSAERSGPTAAGC